MGFMETVRRRGRPRIFVSNAERQKAYRKRAKTTRPPTTADSLAWNKFLVKINLSVSQGLFLKNAPAGLGKLHTGGNNSENLEILDAKQTEEGPCGGGRRVTPGGHGPFDKNEQPTGYTDRHPGQLIQREIDITDAEEALRKSALIRRKVLKINHLGGKRPKYS
jgi:hypothetical protein